MKRFAIVPAIVLAGAAFGQTYNVDLDVTSGSGAGLPAGAFGGPLGTAGTWNSVTSASAMTTGLVDANGANGGVTFTRNRSTGFSSVSNPLVSGNYEKLFEDYQGSAVGGSLIYTFANLPAGTYAVVTSAVYPDTQFAPASLVSVTGSSSQQGQQVGGSLTSNSFFPGSTHAVHVITIGAGGSISVTVAAADVSTTAYCNGLQIRKVDGTRYRMFVNDDAAGASDGGSWTNAFTNPATALRAAWLAGGANSEIWVANGFYKPQGVDRYASFDIPSHLRMYGGFSGTETNLSQRPGSTLSYLNGDIGSTSSDTDNCYNVVVADNTAADTLIDGFFVVNGYGNDGGLAGGDGAGVRLQNGSATFRGCSFSNNWALNYGAGVYSSQGSPTFVDCTFYNNEAFRGSAAYHEGPGVLRMYNCNVLGNDGFESTIFFEGADGVIANCFIHGNYAGSYGGAVAARGTGAQVTIANCTVVGNNAGSICGGAYALQGADLTIDNNIFWDNDDNSGNPMLDRQYLASGSGSTVAVWATTAEGAAGSPGLNPLFVDANGANNVYGDFDDNCQLQAASPCIDTASADRLPFDLGDLDLDGNTAERLPLDYLGNNRVRGVVVDKGAFEFQPPCDLSADLDGDADVDISDLAGLLANYGTPSGAGADDGDLDGDGDVDLSDLSSLLSQFGQTCP